MVPAPPVGAKSAKARYEPPVGSVSGTDQVPSGAISGCTCWKPVVSRRTTIRCIRLSCSTSNAVTGAPSGPVIWKEKDPASGVESVGVRV